MEGIELGPMMTAALEIGCTLGMFQMPASDRYLPPRRRTIKSYRTVAWAEELPFCGFFARFYLNDFSHPVEVPADYSFQG